MRFTKKTVGDSRNKYMYQFKTDAGELTMHTDVRMDLGFAWKLACDYDWTSPFYPLLGGTAKLFIDGLIVESAWVPCGAWNEYGRTKGKLEQLIYTKNGA